MSRHFRLKPAGYAVFGALFLLIGLGVFLIVRAIVKGADGSEASATPTPVIVGEGQDALNAATPSPTLPPLSTTGAPAISTSPSVPPVTSTVTPIPGTPTPAKATATPSSSVRTPTSSEKKNAKSGYVSGNDINLRVGPSTDYMSLGKYSKEDTLVVYATDDSFYFVKMEKDGKIGFMSKKYITLGVIAVTPVEVPSNAIGGNVTASTVAIRNGPSKDNAAVSELHSGDQVFIYSKSGDFYYIEVPSSGLKGYAYASYITASGTVPDA